MTREEIQNQLDALQAQAAEKRKEIAHFEIDLDDKEDEYRDMLDETIEPFMGQYNAAQVLEEVDPTAYRCGLIDYVDGLDKESEPAYKELEEELEAIEDEISDIEDQLEELAENE